jgi:hypothetical protein
MDHCSDTLPGAGVGLADTGAPGTIYDSLVVYNPTSANSSAG